MPGSEKQRLTPEDVVAMLGGAADDESRTRLLAALEDPKSDLSRFLATATQPAPRVPHRQIWARIIRNGVFLTLGVAALSLLLGLTVGRNRAIIINESVVAFSVLGCVVASLFVLTTTRHFIRHGTRKLPDMIGGIIWLGSWATAFIPLALLLAIVGTLLDWKDLSDVPSLAAYLSALVASALLFNETDVSVRHVLRSWHNAGRIVGGLPIALAVSMLCLEIMPLQAATVGIVSAFATVVMAGWPSNNTETPVGSPQDVLVGFLIGATYGLLVEVLSVTFWQQGAVDAGESSVVVLWLGGLGSLWAINRGLSEFGTGSLWTIGVRILVRGLAPPTITGACFAKAATVVNDPVLSVSLNVLALGCYLAVLEWCMRRFYKSNLGSRSFLYNLWLLIYETSSELWNSFGRRNVLLSPADTK